MTTQAPTEINGRTLVKAVCGCGVKVQQWVRAGQTPTCSNCRADADRAANGWTPTNSRD